MKRAPVLKTFLLVPLLTFASSAAPVTPLIPMNHDLMTDGELRSAIPDTLKNEALQTLRNVMVTQKEWVKVHAAEFLIWSGNPEGVREEFLKEEKRFGQQSQYRIGIARVLAQVAASAAEKRAHTDKIMEAFLDESGSDRIHAVETLAKLRLSPVGRDAKLTQDALASSTQSLVMYTRWSVAFTSEEAMRKTKEEMLELLASGKMDSAGESQAAYILRNLGNLTVEQWKRLSAVALNKSKPNVFQYSAAYVTAPKNVHASREFKAIQKGLIQFSRAPSKGERMEFCMALSYGAAQQDLQELTAMLYGANPFPTNSDNEDVKAAAAYALLKNIR